MRDMDWVLRGVVDTVKALNKHIERLESDLDFVLGLDVVPEKGYMDQLQRHEWIGELKREREVWLDTLREERR